VRQFTLAEYERLVKIGVFGPGDRLELLNGWIGPEVTICPPHALAVSLLTRWFNRHIPDGWAVRSQLPVALPPNSEPEPDLLVARGPDERYERRHTARHEIQLIVEVADSSLEQDRGEKLAIYAANNLPAYWIVNLIEWHVEVYKRPLAGKDPCYRDCTVSSPKESIPVLLRGARRIEFPVREVLRAVDP
jgi:Uma2 family endonuclease